MAESVALRDVPDAAAVAVPAAAREAGPADPRAVAEKIHRRKLCGCAVDRVQRLSLIVRRVREKRGPIAGAVPAEERDGTAIVGLVSPESNGGGAVGPELEPLHSPAGQSEQPHSTARLDVAHVRAAANFLDVTASGDVNRYVGLASALG